MSAFIVTNLGTLIAILTSVIGLAVSWGSQKIEIEHLKNELSQVKKDAVDAALVTKRLEIESATVRTTLVSIEKTLLEIRLDLKEMTRRHDP